MTTQPRDAENPIHLWLDSADVPWRLSRLDLEKRYGNSKDPYGFDTIAIETGAPIINGLIYPLSVLVGPQFSPYQPATEFDGVSYFGDDDRRNIQRTAEQLKHPLGEVLIGQRSNTIQCEWTFGAAAVRLMVFPDDMQTKLR